MKGANKAFIKKKEAWLNDNIVFYNVKIGAGGGNPHNDPTDPASVANPHGELPVYDFDLRPSTAMQDASHHHMKGYELQLLTEYVTATKARKVGKYTHALPAYFLPWGSQSTYQGTLDNQADFFFTPTLNGCTFAVSGTPANPKVSHGNYVNAVTQKIDQAQIDADVTNIHGVGGPSKILHKTGYKIHAVGTEDYRVTIVGIRNAATGWKFYYQRYQIDLNPAGGGWIHRVMDRVVAL